MAITPNQLPTISSGLTSGFTTNYLNATAYPPNKFSYTTFNWTGVQAIINAGIDFYNLPSYVNVNLNVLKYALRKRYITLQPSANNPVRKTPTSNP